MAFDAGRCGNRQTPVFNSSGNSPCGVHARNWDLHFGPLTNGTHEHNIIMRVRICYERDKVQRPRGVTEMYKCKKKKIYSNKYREE